VCSCARGPLPSNTNTQTLLGGHTRGYRQLLRRVRLRSKGLRVHLHTHMCYLPLNTNETSEPFQFATIPGTVTCTSTSACRVSGAGESCVFVDLCPQTTNMHRNPLIIGGADLWHRHLLCRNRLLRKWGLGRAVCVCACVCGSLPFNYKHAPPPSESATISIGANTTTTTAATAATTTREHNPDKRLYHAVECSRPVPWRYKLQCVQLKHPNPLTDQDAVITGTATCTAQVACRVGLSVRLRLWLSF
jgi:hypothetical protein